jgi:DNA transformation protein
MKRQSQFVEFLHEAFEEFGPVETRKMFGGYGIYHDGLMFGLVENDILYLKADSSTKKYFKSKNLSQFQYKRKDKMVKMSYYRAPEEIYDDPSEATIWAKRAYEAASRGTGGK